MAKTAKVSFSNAGAVDSLTVRIDDKKLSLTNGAGSKSVSAGQHYLQWVGVGPQGVKLKVAITAPSESSWSKSVAIASDGLFGGSKKFHVNQK